MLHGIYRDVQGTCLPNRKSPVWFLSEMLAGRSHWGGGWNPDVRVRASENSIVRNNKPPFLRFISHFFFVACIMGCTRLSVKCSGIPSFCAGHLEFVESPCSLFLCLSCLRRPGRLRYPWVFAGERRSQASLMSSPTQNVTSSLLCCLTVMVRDTLKG